MRSSIEYYEILPQNISKGTALEELRKACGMEDFTFVAQATIIMILNFFKRLTWHIAVKCGRGGQKGCG